MPKKVVLCILATVCMSLLSVHSLLAGIGVAPTVLELRIPEGSEEKGEWTVANTADQPIRVNVDIEDWLKSGGLKDPQHWLEVEPREFILGPNETKSVEYRVKIPQGLDGEAMVMVFFTSSNVEGSPSMIKPRVGVALYIINKGTEKLSAEIEDIRISKITGGIKIDIKIKNNGNVHIRPKGEVTIKDKKGHKLYDTTLQYGWPVLPHREHIYPAFIKDAELKKGKYKAIAEVQFGSLYEKEEIISNEIDFSVDKEGSIKIE